MGENDVKKVLKNDIIEASLLLGSGLFDDEPEEVFDTRSLKAQGTGITEENPKSSSGDASDPGFSVSIDDKRTVSDTRKAQLEVIRYFLRTEPNQKNGADKKREKLEDHRKPCADAAKSLNDKGQEQRNTIEEKLQIPTREKSKIRPKSIRIDEKVRKKHHAADIEKAVPKVKAEARQEVKVKKNETVQKKHPVGSLTTSRPKDKRASDNRSGLMSMKLKDRGSGENMKSMMDLKMDMTDKSEGMAEYFRR
ncbi:hypothetical protein [Youngiibacter multivorans]|uniref:Uncharacterized protein n=1 Tax=Youngiibacter multivorans TaxID=937251 RepID=A0ABS4FZS9_9CLOT|nr:hypothetical protein [Youngiibacter multivorans]MBP1917808.1 hypothetical protein [Youngiibacter multivorans]